MVKDRREKFWPVFVSRSIAFFVNAANRSVHVASPHLTTRVGKLTLAINTLHGNSQDCEQTYSRVVKKSEYFEELLVDEPGDIPEEPQNKENVKTGHCERHSDKQRGKRSEKTESLKTPSGHLDEMDHFDKEGEGDKDGEGDKEGEELTVTGEGDSKYEERPKRSRMPSFDFEDTDDDLEDGYDIRDLRRDPLIMAKLAQTAHDHPPSWSAKPFRNCKALLEIGPDSHAG